MDVTKKKPTQRERGDKRNIPEAVHREAERVARNLMRLPAKSLK